jgi:hypothetical protein
MGSTVSVRKPEAEALRLTNPTGVALVKDEFTVFAGRALVALEAIGIAAVGSLDDVAGKELQAADYVNNEGAFATGNLPVYWDPTTKKFSQTSTAGYYFVGTSLGAKSGTVIDFVACVPILVVAAVSSLASALTAETSSRQDITARSGIPFTKIVKLTSALATTPVDILTDVEVGAANKAIITDIDVSVGGTSAWVGTGTVVLVRDKAGSPVTQVSLAKAQLTSQAQLGKHTAGVTLSTAVRTGAGATQAKGLELVADGTFETSGSDLSVIVSGIIVAA